MLEILPKIIFYKFFRTFGFPKMLPMNYTISLLYECNSRCRTCNVYKKKAKNLSLAEYKKLFRNIGKSPYWITLSGGEPFLRKDIVEICKIIYNYSRPKIINIPTNGILTKRIVENVSDIAKICVKSQIIINLSIDAIGKYHDKIRNVPGNYRKVINTFNELKKLPHKNLSVGIHTVISQLNVDKFASISTALIALKPDSYITEIAEERVELGTMGKNITPSKLAYKSAADFLIHRIKHQHFTGMNKITQGFRIEYYNFAKKILRDKEQVLPCYAGIASVQISPDGDFGSCCIKAKSMGNLREENFDFRKIWNNEQFSEERRSIKNKECYCPLANAAYTNMLMNFPTLFKVLFRLLKMR